jgi:sporulation protein YlmC with PRC-barrel domain
MRLAELDGARVVGADGKSLGRVRELHCTGGEITHLGIGAGTLLQRFAGGRRGRRIPWSAVAAMKDGALVLGGD